MRVLLACEESQEVCREFRRRAPFKSGAQDIAKAIRCLEYMTGEVTAEDD